MPSRLVEKLLHPLCLIGGVIVAIGFVASVIGLVIDVLAEKPSAYQGLLTLVLFPGVSFFGLLCVMLGLWLEGRRAKRLVREGKEWAPRLDPGERRHRWLLLGIAGFSILFVVLSIIGAFHAYEFTESTTFCGAACHTPMEPQYTTHQFSPHANVPCTTCHVGPGVQGYVEAKVSGLRQLVQMLGSSYPRPIRAGHDKLLIAGQSCERCHRPEKFWGPRLDSRTRFGYDLRNSPRSLRMLLKPGGPSSEVGEPGGHWHAGLTISYRPTDDEHQEIPWVRVRKPDGTTVVYEDEKWEKTGREKLVAEETMSCVGCHSRPAHRFRTPDETVNQALATGAIHRSLPFIKKIAVTALAKNYTSTEEALLGIKRDVESFYRDNFEGEVLARRESLARSIAEIQRIYGQNVFPEMKTKWSTHPDNAGHRKAPGCFRCHSGRHLSRDGKVLDRDCSTCHVFFERAEGAESLIEVAADASAYHPFEHSSHKTIDCWTCHTESSSPYSQCRNCHATTTGGHAMQFECSICHKPGKPKEAGTACAPCHPAGASTLHAHRNHGDCISCHRPHQWGVAAESCSQSRCHEQAKDDYLKENLPAFRGVLSHMSGLPVGKR